MVFLQERNWEREERETEREKGLPCIFRKLYELIQGHLNQHLCSFIQKRERVKEKRKEKRGKRKKKREKRKEKKKDFEERKMKEPLRPSLLATLLMACEMFLITKEEKNEKEKEEEKKKKNWKLKKKNLLGQQDHSHQWP